MIDLDRLEKQVQEGYSISPFDGGRALIEFVRAVEAETDFAVSPSISRVTQALLRLKEYDIANDPAAR